MTTVSVPDIGDFKNIPVIEIHVKPGDMISAESPLVTLESDKATMEVPAPAAGKVSEVLVKLGDKVSMGSALIRLEGANGTAPPGPAGATGVNPTASPAGGPRAMAAPSPAVSSGPPPAAAPSPEARMPIVGLPPIVDFAGVHASPAVRRLARELDIDLTRITGTGEHARITRDDVKRSLGKGPGVNAPPAGSGIPDIPAQDFSKFGAIDTVPLSRLKKQSGPFLHRAWLNVPHVTHQDEADITELESYRGMLDGAAKEKGYRVTMIAFLMKASVVALKAHPELNSSLSPDKQSLILKRYYNIGVAVDTPDGLVVPVIKEVDRKGILELSQELANTSKKMREGKIAPADIQGGSFSISSLGGIGGTGFTPLVAAPEVAILGVARATMKPVWDGKAFQPRLMLPLCLSYDHRVVDGALGARFTRRIAEVLGDLRQLVL